MTQKKIKIILVLLEAPLPFGSAAARWYSVLVDGLIQRPVELKLFAACSSLAQMNEAQKKYPFGDFCVFPNTQRGWIDKFRSLVAPYSYHFSKEIVRRIRLAIDEGADVVHLEQIWSIWAIGKKTARAMVNVHYLSSIDLESKGSRQEMNFIQRKLPQWTEKRLLKRLQWIQACTPRLSEVVSRWFPKKKVIWSLPFGIQSSRYEFLPVEKRKKSKTILLVASMGWAPGKSAAIRLLERIWPRILVSHPDAKLQIVGWNAKDVLARYRDAPGVEILSDVPNTQKYFHEAAFLIYAPEVGSGMKIKVIEAMLYGLPVLTNLEGIEGLGDVDETVVWVRKSDNEFIEAASLLLNDLDLQSRLRKNARSWVERHCDPNTVVNNLMSRYSEMIESAKIQ